MNDIETTAETCFKVHKLPTRLHDQAALTRRIEAQIKEQFERRLESYKEAAYEYPNRHYI